MERSIAFIYSILQLLPKHFHWGVVWKFEIIVAGHHCGQVLIWISPLIRLFFHYCQFGVKPFEPSYRKSRRPSGKLNKGPLLRICKGGEEGKELLKSGRSRCVAMGWDYVRGQLFRAPELVLLSTYQTLEFWLSEHLQHFDIYQFLQTCTEVLYCCGLLENALD